MQTVTIHDIIHALENLEDVHGEGQTITNIEFDEGTENEKPILTVYTADAVFPIPLDDWE